MTSNSASPPPSVMLVVPAYEEERRLPPFLTLLAEEVSTEFPPGTVEILVVDDGSSAPAAEAMAKAVAELGREYPWVRPIHQLPVNSGKGGAVYAGWGIANPATTWLAFVDADGAVSAAETVRLIRLAVDLPTKEPRTAIFALRDTGNREAVKRTLIRGLLGQVFRQFVRSLFNLSIPDTQCGLKLVPQASYQKIRPRLTEKRFCFDVELTALLERKGVEIKGVPIRWEESPGSKVRFGSALKMLLSLASIRYNLGVRTPDQ